MALRKADRRRDVSESLILIEQPRAFEIPPFDAVEEIIEAGVGECLDFIHRGAEILGQEQDIRVEAFGGPDQPPPDLRRHLVSRVATKSAKAQTGIMAD